MRKTNSVGQKRKRVWNNDEGEFHENTEDVVSIRLTRRIFELFAAFVRFCHFRIDRSVCWWNMNFYCYCQTRRRLSSFIAMLAPPNNRGVWCLKLWQFLKSSRLDNPSKEEVIEYQRHMHAQIVCSVGLTECQARKGKPLIISLGLDFPNFLLSQKLFTKKEQVAFIFRVWNDPSVVLILRNIFWWIFPLLLYKLRSNFWIVRMQCQEEKIFRSKVLVSTIAWACLLFYVFSWILRMTNVYSVILCVDSRKCLRHFVVTIRKWLTWTVSIDV